MYDGRRRLKKYEIKNLVFFLSFIVALGVLGAFVFKSYKDRDLVPPKPFDPNGILNEFISPTADSCYFHLGTRLTESTQRYHSPKDIPAADDGLIKGLFSISGVVEVVVDQKLVVLQKSPKAHWEEIQPAAREILTAHLHMHK
jgi:hypothetical protein